MPSTMHHIAVREPGPPEVMTIVEGPVPTPRPGEVLIDVAWAGVNRPDCLQRAGAYPPPPDASPILGLEVAGRVGACGPDVEGWKVGADVCALTPGGGYAEYCTTPAAWCLPIPRGLSLEQAASLLKRISPFGTTCSTRAPRGRRDAARPWRNRRHRPDRDPARQGLSAQQ
jgi:NADPH:quinone reductase-like Zn-dependent oxidoreductase